MTLAAPRLCANPGFIVRATVLIVALLISLSAIAQQPAGLPDTARQLAERSEQARLAGDAEQERRLLEDAIAAAGEANPAAFALLGRLRMNLADRGNFVRAAEAGEKQLLVARLPGQEHQILISLVSTYAALHQKGKAAAAFSRLQEVTRRLRAGPRWGQRGGFWQAGTAWAKAALETGAGHLKEAEESWRACLVAAEGHLTEHPEVEGHAIFVECTRGLLNVLITTGQLAAAEALADPLRIAGEKTQDLRRRPGIDVRVKQALGRLALEQGRIGEARRILLEALASLEDNHSGDSSMRAAGLRLQLAMLEMLSGNWEKALDWHRQREAALQRAGAERGRTALVSNEYAYTLQRLGRTEEALAMLDRLVAGREKLYDENSIFWWETRAFRGIALAAGGQRDAALLELAVAMPRLLDIVRAERSSPEAGLLRTTRLNWLLDGYLSVLSGRAAGAGPDAAATMDEAFRLADLARGSTVQRALAASASRAKISDPELSALARREQDLLREAAALSETIGDLLARQQIGENDRILNDLRAELGRLREAHAGALADIERRYPDYAALLTPRPVEIAATQNALRPGEALVSIYAGEERTLVWAVSAATPPCFAIVPLTRARLDEQVMRLRRSVESGDSIAELPPFDTQDAHALYRALLAPVESCWKDAREMIVVPHGRLGQLPFGLLLTAPVPANAALAEAPWLIRRFAIAQLPSVTALPLLRSPGREQHADRPFIGFGDPAFNTGDPGAETRRGLRRRQSVAMNMAQEQGKPPDFSLLPRLPETAREINDIATLLAADRDRDVYLQKRASESLLRQAPLARYRIVMFATHGLNGGEMPGLFQPALALSNPVLSGDDGDGLLTLDEILGLKLNADWVVLSACNTGAGSGSGEAAGEAISGLGRAFFFAGARALLVTQWAVETESARLLTTETFRLQAATPGLSRARALQRSALWLMRQGNGNATGYSHPMFWAPYALVGDGG